MKEQLKLWRDANKKEQWHDAPAKVKVEIRNDIEWGLCHMHIEFTLGLPPQAAAYDVLTNPDNQLYSRVINHRELMFSLAYCWQVHYGKMKMMFMEMFEGNYTVEPIYVDSERLCKHMKPKSREEYRKCSGGQGRIASKVEMNQVFKPSSLFNLPPLSWYILSITIKTTKTLVQDLQDRSAMIRGV
ncbi:unnamed protein product [Arabis nemorensis]|uniref:DUF220 domain-containing protein n=1 Tax=Arabis nemorensis TaxID=586526 RepID=A0A565ASC7_9BRAS|nr:unnamed protein product [Arabis nemorensis]